MRLPALAICLVLSAATLAQAQDRSKDEAAIRAVVAT